MVYTAAPMAPGLALVLALFVLWNGAFLAAPHTGVWLPICSAALVLDLAAFWAHPPLRRLSRPAPWALGLGLAAAAVQIAASIYLYPPAWKTIPGLWDSVNGLYRLLGHPNGWQAWIALPFVVVSEELVYRGAVQGLLEPKLGRWLAAPAAVVVYLLAHLGSGNWALIALTVPCGLYWGLLRAATKSLWAPMLCHLLWDWAILVVVPLGA
ncbi:MAG: type II CAAX endopeptidase family protein [Myxococcales bacterium]